MSLPAMLLAALGLAMDAFAVSVATGISMETLKGRYAVKTGVFFGLFQCLMPLLGYLAGSTISAYIEAVDHWVAFLLLSYIGAKMIVDGAMRKTKEAADPTQNLRLLALAVATSVDALAVGVGLAVMDADIVRFSVLTGLVTFALCAAGVCVGKKMGAKFLHGAMCLGGAALCLIGVKILIEHLM